MHALNLYGFIFQFPVFLCQPHDHASIYDTFSYCCSCSVFAFCRKEIFEGGEILKEKMLKFLPRIALFNGKGIYEVFCGHKKFYFGLQPEPFPGCPNTVSTTAQAVTSLRLSYVANK